MGRTSASRRVQSEARINSWAGARARLGKLQGISELAVLGPGQRDVDHGLAKSAHGARRFFAFPTAVVILVCRLAGRMSGRYVRTLDGSKSWYPQPDILVSSASLFSSFWLVVSTTLCSTGGLQSALPRWGCRLIPADLRFDVASPSSVHPGRPRDCAADCFFSLLVSVASAPVPPVQSRPPATLVRQETRRIPVAYWVLLWLDGKPTRMAQ